MWFLYEWLTGEELDLPDAAKVRTVSAVDPEKQVAIEDRQLSLRHRIVNSLPGTRNFCPLVWLTESISGFLNKQLDERVRDVIGQAHPDVLANAAAFLILGDSQASFRTEGERPPEVGFF
ncbi:MAG: hypothetical protein BMS9Abin05_2674 [Rhodothermia bacterium]|nr:MAG: hypothetical protein BMS9Abin05_2674 [Rhodothermia bacterium]